MKIFISRPIPQLYQPLFKQYDVDVYEKDEVCPRDILLSRVQGVDAVITQWEDYVDQEFFEAAGSNLKIVANFATGTDRIDKEEANKRGIVITNTVTDSLFAATAEAAVSLLVSVARRTTKLYVMNVEGTMPEYSPIGDMGVALRGKATGIVGLGNIGSKIARIMNRGFDNKILYYNRTHKVEVEKSLKARKVPLEELCKEADFIFITIPHNPTTNDLISKEILNLVKTSAILVSISPAEVIDNVTLVRLVESGNMYGAGLDIYPSDLKPLHTHNLILTAHSTNAEKETTNTMVELCAKNINSVLRGKPPLTPVST